MANGRKPNLTENQNTNSNGERRKAKYDMKDRRDDSRSCQPPQIPGSHHDGNAAEKLSEAVGGVEEGPTFFPQEKDKRDESNRLWRSDDVDYQGIDTKSGRRPSQRVYRSLSETADEDLKSSEKDHNNIDINTDVKKLFSLNDKKSAIWGQHELEPVGASNIRLSGTASCDQPLERGQTNVRLGETPGQENSIHTCTDVGGVDSAVSGSTEDKSYSRSRPLNIKSNEKYIQLYHDVRKQTKASHKQRMRSRKESGCSSSDFCFHPDHELKHDWITHDAKEMQIYNYTSSRMGHIFKRERNTNLHEEAGTCCHIGDGYVLTCYHCIKEILWRDSWPNELLLKQDLAVTFPDVGPHPGSRILRYSFEPCLLAFCEDLDYAVLKLDIDNSEQIPPHFTTHTNVTGGQEHPVYVAGYQLHPEHTCGKVVVDATALKLPLHALNLDVVEGWSKVLNFQMHIQRLNDGMDPWKSTFTYYPLKRCGQNFPVLTSLIYGASGGFGLTYTAQDESPVVNFLYRAGYPHFYYKSMFGNTSTLCDDHQVIQNVFSRSPCLTFQEGVPIGAIVDEIRKSPDTSLSAIPFLRRNV